MDVQIGELSSTVRAVDGEALLSPQIMQRILELVMKAMEEREMHTRRVRNERRMVDSVRVDMDQEREDW